MTKNLYEALLRFRAFVAEGRFSDFFDNDDPLFWIDAICIDQGNNREKEQQIPRMQFIYSDAACVFCWLGENMMGEDEVILERLFFKGMEIGNQEQALAGNIKWVEQYPLKQEIGSEDYESFKDAFSKIVELPWFTRIWCIQEAVFAPKAPIFVLGSHISSRLHIMWIVFDEAEADTPLKMTETNLGVALIEGFRTWRSKQSKSKDLKSFAKRLDDLVRILLQGYKCTVPHDMVYAILSLADPPDDLPQALRPNYEKPFAEVYREYTKFIISLTGNLNLLGRIGWDLESETPSWVSDFRQESYGLSAPSVLGTPVFTDRDRKLQLQGVYCGEIVAVHIPQGSRSTLDAQLEDLIPSFDDILYQFAQLQGISDFGQALNEYFSSAVGAADPSLLDVVTQMYSLALTELVRRREAGPDRDQGEDIRFFAVENLAVWETQLEVSRSLVLMAVRTLFEELKAPFVVTDNGSVARCCRATCEPKVGDVLYAAKGASEALLLRKQVPNDFQLLSTCRIRVGLPAVYDEAFYASHNVTTFSLV